jgi:hypothetical protein
VGTLAFDRERVGQLARRLAEALEALGRVPSEPVTADAAAVVRAVRDRLAPWHHRLVALSGCGVLEDYRPVAPDPTDLLDAHLLALAADPRWSLSTDPGSASVDWGQWAGALGRLLASGDLGALLRDDGVRALREQLSAVARSPDAGRELLAELGVIGLIRLVDALGARWRAEQDALRRFPHRSPNLAPSEAGADAAHCLRLLGALLASGPHVLAALTVAARAEPDGAAELVAGARLGGSALGWAVATLLGRWAEADAPWWLERRMLPAPLPDRLLRLVVDDPAAAGLVVDRLAGAGQLAPLLFGGLDDDLGLQVLQAATQPDTTGERAAGRRLLALLSWLRTEPLWSAELMTATTSDPGLLERWEHLRRALGALVAPWQLHLSALAPRWGARPEDTIEHLVWVADHPRSAAALAAGLAPAVARLGTVLPADAAERRAVVNDLADGIGASAEVLRDAETDEWHERRSRIQTVIALVDRLPVVSHPVARAAKGAGLQALADWLAGDGDAVADRAITSEQERLDHLADVLAWAVWVDAWRAGRIDASAGAPDPELTQELQHARDAVANPAGRGDALAARAAN